MKPRNLQTVNAMRDEELIIDLGMEFEGELTASLSRDRKTNQGQKEFEIIDNRYLKLTRDKANDEIIESETVSILGRWYFDVRQTTDTSSKFVYTGTIYFRGNITK